MATKIERIENYIVLTDLVSGHKDEYPADDVYYRNDSQSIAINHKFNKSLVHIYLWTELRDEDGNAWADLPTLLAWLRKYTGSISSPTDLFLDIPSGDVTGTSSVNKFGENEAIAGDTEEDIWDGGGDYPFPDTALITSMSQTANQVAMLGANIEIQGLDANWDLTIQTTPLNGSNTTTVVTLATPLIRIFRAKVQADVVSTSPIRIHNAAETVDYAIITTGYNQTLMAIYTVPNGKTAYMTNYYGDVVNAANKSPKNTQFELFAADRDNGYEFQIKHEKAIPQNQVGFQHFFKPYYKFTQKTDIKLSAECDSEDGHVHAGFDLILVDN